MVSGSLIRYCLKLAIACLLFTSSSFSVEVSGTGYTSDAALKNALRNGIERKIVSYISEYAFIKNKDLINKEYLSNVSRYILKSNVLSTKKMFGLFQVEVQIDINNLTLKEHLIAHDFSVKRVNKPSILLFIDEYHDNRKMSENTAGLALKEILIENGYAIQDIKLGYLISDISNISDSKYIAQIGFENDADLVIKGIVNTGKSTPVDVYENKQLTVPLQMNLEVIRTDNSQIVTSHTLNLRRNATSEYSALQLALTSAAKETGRSLVAKLDAYCESDEYTDRHFELIIDGLNYTQANKLESDILTLACIRDVTFRYLDNQRAVFGISAHGSLAELRKELSSGKIPGISIVSFNRGTIVVKYGSDLLQTVSPNIQSDVDIVSLSIDEIFPSRIRYYAEHPAGYLTLRSLVPVSDVQLSLSLPELLSEPFQVTRRQFASGENKIEMHIVPDYGKILNIMQARIIQGQLVLKYSVAGQVFTRLLTIPVTVHGINGMNWDHPEAISSFIVNDDPIVRLFSRQAIQGLPIGSEINKDLVNAIAVHAAIRKYGIQYVKDPLPASGKQIDMVQYPSQTLFHRTGDCDDLSVLYCSLLSSLGIPVALVSYDDHVFFMFGTGIYEKNRLALSPDTTLTVVHNKKLWIPIEATDIHSSFVENWHTTARKFHDAQNAGREVRIIDIQEAWKLYPPVSLFEGRLDIKLQSVNNLVETELKKMHEVTTRQYAQEIAHLISMKKKDKKDLAVVDNKIGLLYVRSGDSRQAIHFFKEAYDINKSTEILSNYAGALLLSGKQTKAMELFETIYKKDAGGKVAINRALCKYFTSGDSSAVKEFYEYMFEAISVIQSDANLSEILGFDISSQDSLRGSNRSLSYDTSKLDMSILTQTVKNVNDIIKQRKISGITTESSSGSRFTGTTTETSTGTTADNITKDKSPFNGLRGAATITLQKLVDLLYWFDF
jgi:hypothetical protein